MRRWAKWLLIGLPLIGLPATGWLVWRLAPVHHAYYSDGDTIRQPCAIITPRDILWQPPIDLGHVLNTSSQDYEPRLSWDGQTLYFVRGRAGGNADIYVSRRTPCGWTEPKPLTDINTDFDELGPEPAPDGKAIYFYSDRPGGRGGYDLWVSRRGPSGWQAPMNLGPAVNSEFNDYGVALAPDGAKLYFASNRPNSTAVEETNPHAWPATLREDLVQRTYDLYESELTPAGPNAARPLAALNTRHDDGTPAISPAGDFLYFSSDRPGGVGGFDLYRARLRDNEFGPPANLHEPVNTPHNELDPGLTHLGYALYFSSDRGPAGDDGTDGRDYNLFFTTAREVFLELESQPRPPLNWAALRTDLWPLWLALLVGLLALLLYLVAGSMNHRRLNRLARCLVASLVLHSLLLLGLSFWQVSGTIADVFRRGGVRVTLAAPGQADALSAQIRGAGPEIALPESAKFEARPPQPHLLTAPLIPRHGLTVPRATVPDREPSRPELAERKPATPPSPVRPLEWRTLQHEPLPFPRFDMPVEARRTAVAESRLSLSAAATKTAGRTRRSALPSTRQTARLEPAAVLETAAGRVPADAERRSEGARPPALSAALVRVSAPPSTPTQIVPGQSPRFDIRLPDVQDRRAQADPVIMASVGATTRAARRAPRAAVPRSQAKTRVPAATTWPLPPQLPPEQSSEDVQMPLAHATPATQRPAAGWQAAPSRPALMQPLDVALPPVREVARALENEAAGSIAPARLPSRRTSGSASQLAIAPDLAMTRIAPRPGHDKLPTRRLPVGIEPCVPDTAAIPRARRLKPRNAAAVTAPTLALGLPIPIDITHDAEGGAETLRSDEFESIGFIEGHVFDAETDKPLARATVQLELSDTSPLTALTDTTGYFKLPVPMLPDFVAVAAARVGYLPVAVNVPAERLDRGRAVQDFRLERATSDAIPLERVPRVHHIGNDRFEGRINSQFQKPAEGRVLRAIIPLTVDEIPPTIEAAQVTFLAKGVQCPHKLYVNGELVPRRIGRSPADGSFGDVVVPFDPALLREGRNVLMIVGVRCRGDVDDFEVVNIQLHLKRAVYDL